jgi:hypothetical protein
MSTTGSVLPTYLGGGDPAHRFTDYFPPWLENMADDVTLEGSMLDGAVRGPEAVRSVVLMIRSMYDRQEFNYAGPYGEENGWLEDYIAQVHGGEPLGCVVLVDRGADGQTRRVTASYRPRASLMRFARLLGEKFAGTAIGEQFASSES